MSTYDQNSDWLNRAQVIYYNESPSESGSYWKYDNNNKPYIYFFNAEGEMIFEAENAIMSGECTIYTNDQVTLSGGKMIGDFASGDKLTFVFDSLSASTVHFYINCVFSETRALSELVTITVNGVAIDLSQIQADDYQDNWWKFVEYDLGEITLVEGENIIEFIPINSPINVDFLRIVNP